MSSTSDSVPLDPKLNLKRLREDLPAEDSIAAAPAVATAQVVAAAARTAASAQRGFINVRDRNLWARVLYPNPVCLLVTRPADEVPATSHASASVPKTHHDEAANDDDDAMGLNAMVISWLTAINNDGGLVLSVNRRRASASRVALPGATFELHVATSHMIDLLLSVGSCSGAATDKFLTIPGLQLEPVRVVNAGTGSKKNKNKSKNTNKKSQTEEEVAEAEAEAGAVVMGAVARLQCTVSKVDDDVDAGHHVVFARITSCLVDERFWSGKQLVGHADEAILTFLGTQRFGFVASEPHLWAKPTPSPSPVPPPPPPSPSTKTLPPP